MDAPVGVDVGELSGLVDAEAVGVVEGVAVGVSVGVGMGGCDSEFIVNLEESTGVVSG